MKALLIFPLLAMVSLNSFAADTSFRVLNCYVDEKYPTEIENMFSMQIRLKQAQSAINPDPWARTFKADIEIKSRDYNEVIKDITLAQETSFYGHQLSFHSRISNSSYQSYLFLHPSFKGVFSKKLVDFDGNTEINVKSDASRFSNGELDVIKTSKLKCQIAE
jgi:hypothetical protein